MQSDPVGKSKRLIEVLGCNSSASQQEMLHFLKEIDTKTIFSSMFGTLSEDERRRGLPIPFKPCVEQDLVCAVATFTKEITKTWPIIT